MNKLINVTLLVSIILSIFAPTIVNAEEMIKVGTIVVDTSVRVRSAPVVNDTNELGRLYNGNNFVVLGTAPDDGACGTIWYQFSYGGDTAYVCGTYVTVADVPVSQFTNGFPASYQSKLAVLKALHPNWEFVPQIINVDWNTIIDNENSLGKSLIQNPPDGYKHIDSYNFITNTFANNYPGGGSSWYAAADSVIAYYMDPRNFLNENRIFMFETLSYQSAYQNATDLQLMLNGTFMSGKADGTDEDKANNKTYAQIIMEAAVAYNVSPYFLASRIFQEVGRLGSSIVSGAVSGFEGYYNFYNIGATGEQGSIVFNGLTKAKEYGWNSEYDAIMGGAGKISANYIAIGQDTLYLQKWDMVGALYSHQYMQNIQAPYTECLKVYSTYSEGGAINSKFTFNIPVYTNMPASTSLPNPGNPNNWLKTLTVDDKALVGFKPETEQYTITVSNLKTSIKVGATPFVIGTAIGGLGVIPITGDETNINIPVTAQNQTIKTYKLKIIRASTALITIDEVLEAAKYTFDATKIKNIYLGTTTDAIRTNLSKFSLDLTLTIKDINGAIKASSSIGTGDTLTIVLGADTKTYTFIVPGDLNGDSEVSIMDLLRVQRILLGSATLSESFVLAGDVNNDGDVTIIDLLKVQKHILGTSSLN